MRRLARKQPPALLASLVQKKVQILTRLRRPLNTSGWLASSRLLTGRAVRCLRIEPEEHYPAMRACHFEVLSLLALLVQNVPAICWCNRVQMLTQEGRACRLTTRSLSRSLAISARSLRACTRRLSLKTAVLSSSACSVLSLLALLVHTYQKKTDAEGAADFIHEGVKTGENVIVHCRLGTNRSVMVAAAYLMIYHRMRAQVRTLAIWQCEDTCIG